MPTSLFAPDFQGVLDRAVNPPSSAAAPFPSPEDWRDRWIYFLNFGISGFPQGVVAVSRILNDQEVLVIANTNPTQAQQLDVIVDFALSAEGDEFAILYSNQASPLAPLAVRLVPPGGATVNEVDGSVGHGPLHVVRVSLRPSEAQVLRRT